MVNECYIDGLTRIGRGLSEAFFLRFAIPARRVPFEFSRGRQSMIGILLIIAAQAAAPSSTVVSATDENKVRCELVYQVYTRIPDRICRRKSDWARIEKENEADLRNSRNSRASGRSGTIVNSAEGSVTNPNPNFPGSSRRPPR